jgi:hypothetical protein
MRSILHAVRGATFLFFGAAVLAACGAGQAGLSPSASTLLGSSGTYGQASVGDLLYAGHKHRIEIYSFPGGAYQRTLKTAGFVNGMCSDSHGNVFVAEAQGEAGYVYEYEHGGTAPVATLSVPKPNAPVACSSDPTTGNLAVTMQNTQNFTPSVGIYAKAAGTPRVYALGELGADPQGAYDDQGDLFVTSGGNVGAELSAGKTVFEQITLSKTIGGVGHVQWDGKYFALQSFDTTRHQGEKLFEKIFRVQLSGDGGKIVDIISFGGWPEQDPGQSWISGGTVVATPFSEVLFWAYPAGGKAEKIIYTHHQLGAVTLSPG